MSKVINLDMFAKADLSVLSGTSLWDKEVAFGEVTASNTPETALQSPISIDSLTPGAAYYTRSKFDRLQLVVRTSAANKQHMWISPLHDKDGNPIVSKTNTYSIEQVVANRDFAIPDSDAVINKGDRFVKAYAK